MNIPYVKQIAEETGTLLNPIKDRKYPAKFLNRRQRNEQYKLLRAMRLQSPSNELTSQEVKDIARQVAVSNHQEKLSKCKTNKYKIN